MPAAAYLSIPAGAELIRALVRGISSAIAAETGESLGPVLQQNVTVPFKDRDCRPLSECRNNAQQPGGALAAQADALSQRGETNSVEHISNGEEQGGTSDHRILLNAEIAASTVPAACPRGVLRDIRSAPLDQAIAWVIGTFTRLEPNRRAKRPIPNPKCAFGYLDFAFFPAAFLTWAHTSWAKFPKLCSTLDLVHAAENAPHQTLCPGRWSAARPDVQ
jgi:hypothetical protein